MFTKIKLFSYDFCSLYAIFYNNNCWRRHRDSFHLVVKTCEKCLCLGGKMFNHGKYGAQCYLQFFLRCQGENFKVITYTDITFTVGLNDDLGLRNEQAKNLA